MARLRAASSSPHAAGRPYYALHASARNKGLCPHSDNHQLRWWMCSFGFVTGAAAPWAARIGITPQALEVVALYQPGPPGRRRCHAAEGPGCPSQPAGNCSLCRGGYHPPACPRNRLPRGARQGELPQRGKRRCPGVRPGPPPVCPRNHWPRGARRPGAPFVYRGAPWRRPTGSPALRGSPRAPSHTAPGSAPPQCTAAY